MKRKLNTKNENILKSEKCLPGKVESLAIDSSSGISIGKSIFSKFEYNQLIDNNCLNQCSVILKSELNNDFKTTSINEKNEINESYEVCPRCLKKVLKSDYEQHLINHLRTLKCDKCKYLFSEKELKTHSCEKFFRCDPCAKGFIRRCHYDAHLRWHVQIENRKLKPVTVTCPECNLEIKRYNVKRHARLHTRKLPISTVQKRPRKSYLCQICGKDCKSSSNYVKHEKSHIFQSRNPCNQCEASFSTYVQLVRHNSQVHLGIKGGLSQCPICHKNYLNIGTHMKTHDNELGLICPKCSATLPNSLALKNHVRHHDRLAAIGRDREIIPHPWKTPRTNTCAPLKQNTCPLCGLRYHNMDQLLKHKKRHISLRIHPCMYCEGTDKVYFSSMLDLVKHICLVHIYIPQSHLQCYFGDKIVPAERINSHWNIHRPGLFECEICDKKFFILKEYERHNRSIHSKSIRKMSKLQILMKKYSKQKSNFRKVPCFRCRRKIRISYMISHLRHHQMFRCLCCEKRFFKNSSLNRHEIKHNSGPSQRCPVCSRSFVSHIRLIAHLKMVHQMTFTASKSCDRCAI